MNEIGHLKIAITSNDLLQVDANFATAKQIVIYDVTYDEANFLDVVQFKGGGKSGEGKRGPGPLPDMFKSGLYHLARAHPQVQIIPVWLDGPGRARLEFGGGSALNRRLAEVAAPDQFVGDVVERHAARALGRPATSFCPAWNRRRMRSTGPRARERRYSAWRVTY